MAGKEYFTVRLNRILIHDNHEWGSAEVKILSFITSGNDSLPSLAGYAETNSEDEKKAKIALAAKDMLSVREFIEVYNVRDEAELTFGSADAGLSVFTSNKIPLDINWTLALIEKDTDIRAIGTMLETVIESSEFDGFASNLITLIGTAASPQIMIAYRIGKFIAAQAGKALANNKDDQIGLFAVSLNRFQHYKNGERKRDGVRGINGNMSVDYTLFGTEY